MELRGIGMTKNEIREEFWNGGLAIHAVSHEE